jgi:hypothetical protein
MTISITAIRALSKRELRKLAENVERYALQPGSRYYKRALQLVEAVQAELKARSTSERVVTCYGTNDR